MWIILNQSDFEIVAVVEQRRELLPTILNHVRTRYKHNPKLIGAFHQVEEAGAYVVRNFDSSQYFLRIYEQQYGFLFNSLVYEEIVLVCKEHEKKAQRSRLRPSYLDAVVKCRNNTPVVSDNDDPELVPPGASV